MTCICTSMDMTSRYPAEFERPLSGNWRRTSSLLPRRSFLRPQHHSLWSSICHRDDMVNVSLHERLPLEISDQEINLRRALRASVGTLRLQPYAAIKLLSCVKEYQARRGALRVVRESQDGAGQAPGTRNCLARTFHPLDRKSVV